MTTLDSYDTANRNTVLMFYGAYPANNSVYYQSFTTPDDGQNYKLTQISNILMTKQAGTVCTFQVEVYAHTGTYGTTSAPTGAALATSDEIDQDDMETTEAAVAFTFSGANQIILSPNTHYVLAVKCLTHDGNTIISVGVDSSSPTHSGNAGSWTSA